MASDRQQWRQAEQKWLELLEAKAFSVYPSVGQVAIVCSTHSVAHGSAVRNFAEEAYTLADRLARTDGRPLVVIGPTASDVASLVADRTVASMITIGDGTVSSLILGPKTDPPNPERVFSWDDVSRAATHLKLGVFAQHQSGIMRRDLNVPLGLFAMADHRNVLAPLGRDYRPEEAHMRYKESLGWVSPTARMTLEQVRALPMQVAALGMRFSLGLRLSPQELEQRQLAATAQLREPR